MHAPLWPEWCALVSALGLSKADEWVYAELHDRYREPQRHYHNLDHVVEVLALVNELQAFAEDLTAVQLAAWFHDAIYDPRASDNEERSADLAEQLLRGWPPPRGLLDRVRSLILLTKTHQAAADDRDAAVLLDADLGILGAPPERYLEYAQAIRREYAFVPDAAYRRGRTDVLRNFLNRPRIYRTEPMLATREEQARRNLEAEFAAHSGQSSNTP
jgi:predicted metal-dependent HD superfamily phosphohydrolase